MTTVDDESTSAASGEQTTVYFRITGSASDAFCRRNPAIFEGPEPAWRASRELIDFATLVLELSGKVQAPTDEEKVRAFAYLALLRRALVTAEAGWQLLAKGLHEPALAQVRTLLDIHLNLKLIADDPSPRVATRLGAYHYLRNQRHGERMLRDRETAAEMFDAETRASTIEVARSYARHLESPVFDAVRDDLRKSRHWHGYDSVEDAFRAAGSPSDYFSSYDAFTSFVHASNIDHDFVDDGDDQPPKLRALVERNPRLVQTTLGFLAFRFLEVVRLFLDGRGLPEELSEEAARSSLIADGVNITEADPVVDDFTGITQRLLAAFSSDHAEEPTPPGAHRAD